MKKLVFSALVMSVVVAAHGYSLYNFEEFSSTSANGSHPGALTTLSSTNDGLTMTITRSGGAGFDIINNDSFNGSGGSMPLTFDHRSLDPFANETTNDFFVGNFSSAISAAEVEMTDFGGDADIIEMLVWSGANGTGTMLADVTTNWGTNSSPSFAAVGWNNQGGANALSITFRGGSEGFPNSMYVDNIAAVRAVPEPATFAVLGVGALALIRRRAKK